MSLHVCDKCNKEFNKKDHYINHLMKKNECNTNLKNKYHMFNCKNCDQSFSRNRNLTRHLKTCKMENCEKNQNNQNNKKLEQTEIEIGTEIGTESNKELKNEIIKLNKKLEIIEKLIVNSTQIINSEHSTINIENLNNIEHQTVINNNFYIINYKDEKLNDEDMNSILNNDDPILCAVEKIHCNEDNPEQHNILINDKTRNNIYVYENRRAQSSE